MMKGSQLYQQNSYLTVIGVHFTMHLVYPNYCQLTTMYVRKSIVVLANLRHICILEFVFSS